MVFKEKDTKFQLFLATILRHCSNRFQSYLYVSHAAELYNKNMTYIVIVKK